MPSILRCTKAKRISSCPNEIAHVWGCRQWRANDYACELIGDKVGRRKLYIPDIETPQAQGDCSGERLLTSMLHAIIKAAFSFCRKLVVIVFRGALPHGDSCGGHWGNRG